MSRRRRSRKGGIEGISTLLSRVYPAREPDQAHAQRIFASWGRVVSARILENARPVRYQSGVLTVHTSTSAWANALSLESDRLLAKLANRIPGSRLRSIRFRAGPLPRHWDPPPEPARPAPLRPLLELPDEVARELSRIGDDELRDAIARAASLSLSGDKRRAE